MTPLAVRPGPSVAKTLIVAVREGALPAVTVTLHPLVLTVTFCPAVTEAASTAQAGLARGLSR